MLCCDTCVDDSDGVTALGVRHNQKPARRGHFESDYPFLTFRVIGVGTRHCQRVVERTGGFFKCYPVLAEVLSRLDGVPFEWGEARSTTNVAIIEMSSATAFL